MTELDSFTSRCKLEIKNQAADQDLEAQSRHWLRETTKYNYSHHFEWMGRPIIQFPQDIVSVQELIWQVKPDLIIETGIARGGSLILSASVLALLDMCDAVEKEESIHPKKSKRKVLGVDIDIRSNNRNAILAHPMASRIQMLEGSSISPEIVSEVYKIASNFDRILVLLDSNHTHEHVIAELNAYASLTTIGSYCVVFDTLIEEFPNDMFKSRPWGPGNSPKTAICEFLENNSKFVVDKSFQNKSLLTVAPDGWLKRVR